MGENKNRRFVVWSVVGVAVVLIGAVAGGFALSGGTPSPMASLTATAEPPLAASSPTPQPTDLPTPTPGTTQAPTETPDAVEADIDDTASPEKDVAVRVASVHRFEATGALPGEVSGPALRVTVEIDNQSDADLDTSLATLAVDFGDDRVPAPELDDPEAPANPGIVAPGDLGTIVRSFTIPDGETDRMRVSLEMSVGKPTVIFEGGVPAS
ncbi:hypothetical protein [Microbacterium sp.]|uniref:hypothetical protein n=1 Tax=Microbacterium sp. TaxID=51671 RepID=UPI003A863109